jgi:peptidoglycan/LPS O-acetylase OafA/YrhL
LLVGQRYLNWSYLFVRRRRFMVILAVVFFGLSILEFFLVYQRSESLNIAATFIKPFSIAFAFLFVMLIISQPGLESSHRSLWKPIADSSYPIYLIHGAVLSMMFNMNYIRDHVLIGLALMLVFGLTLPLMIDYSISRYAPLWINRIVFGRVGSQPSAAPANQVKGLTR